MKKGSHNNIEEKMSGGGGNSPSLDMEQFIKMADKEKIEFRSIEAHTLLINLYNFLLDAKSLESFKKRPSDKNLRSSPTLVSPFT